MLTMKTPSQRKSHGKLGTPNSENKKKGTPQSNQKGSTQSPLVETISTPKLKTGKGDATPKSGKKIKNSPFKVSPGNLKTPNQESVELNAQSGKKNRKRSSSPVNQIENGKSSAKRPKLQMFSGTSKLKSPSTDEASKVKGNIKRDTAEQKTRLEVQRQKAKTKRHLLASKIQEKDASVIEFIPDLNQKIKAIESRATVTNSGKKKIKQFKRLLQRIEEISSELRGNKANSVPKPTLNKNAQHKNKQKLKKQTIDEQDEATSDEEDDTSETDDKVVDAEDGDENEGESSDDGGDDDDDDNNTSQEQQKDVSDDDDDDQAVASSDDDQAEASNDEDQAEASSDDEENNQIKSKKLKKEEGSKQLKKADGGAPKKTRYVLFVGNLPYSIDKDGVTKHFKQVGKIIDVRIPLSKTNNTHRGFAYLEVENEESYQKGLSLHHTFIDGRQINVMYTKGGMKDKEKMQKEIKAKNFKLSAMRKQGMLAGSVNESQKRSGRRANFKGKKQNTKDN